MCRDIKYESILSERVESVFYLKKSQNQSQTNLVYKVLQNHVSTRQIQDIFEKNFLRQIPRLFLDQTRESYNHKAGAPIGGGAGLSRGWT